MRGIPGSVERCRDVHPYALGNTLQLTTVDAQMRLPGLQSSALHAALPQKLGLQRVTLHRGQLGTRNSSL